MERWFILFIFLILGAHAAAAESIITIGVNESGNANWTMEKHIPLTKPEINEWEAAIKSGHNLSKYKDIAGFNDTINLFTGSAQNFTNRSMKIEDVNISYDTAETVSGGFGIVRYSFMWINFSRTDSDEIFIGDAFPEGLALSSDSVLVIDIPDGYNATSVYPSPDKREGKSLIWGGTPYRNFSKGEPSLLLSHNAAAVLNTTVLPPYGNSIGMDSMGFLVLIVIVVFVSAALVIIWTERRSANLEKKELKQEPWELHEILIIPQVWNKLVQLLHKEFGMKSVEEIEKAAREQRLKESGSEIQVEEDLEYEEMIEQCLIKSGGQAYQSDIVNESRLSKSKISMLLASMKEEGRIIKIRKGKENLIRLARK